MDQVPVCRLCGSDESTLISNEVSGALESQVYRCCGCDIVYLFPIMDLEEEGAFYEQEFPTYMEARNAPGGADAEAHFKANLPEAERRKALILPFLPENASILEVGSSTGYFLHYLREYATSTTGIEPGESFADYARERGIRTLDDLKSLGDEKFDVILLYYVLEHMRDPVGFLEELRGHLNPKGRILLEVPNVDDVLLSVYDIPPFGPFYYQRAHYYNFSKATLERVMTQAGFETKVLPAQRYDLSNHMHWMMAGRPGGMGKYSEIFSEELETSYKESLKRNWVSDTLFGVGISGTREAL